MKTFTVSVPSLQNLTIIGYIDDLDYVINAPCLKYLEVIEIDNDDSAYLIENMPELVEANITDVSRIFFENIIGSLTSVKRLSLKIASPFEVSFFLQLVEFLVVITFLLLFVLIQTTTCIN